MYLVFGLLWLITGFLQGVRGQGVYGKDVTDVQILCSTRSNIYTSLLDLKATPRPHQLDLVRGVYCTSAGLKTQQVGSTQNTHLCVCVGAAAADCCGSSGGGWSDIRIHEGAAGAA